MLLKDFLNELSRRKEEGQAFRNICKENKISYKKLSPLLKDLGFEYNHASFEWIYKGSDKPPLNIDLLDKVPMRSAAQRKHSSSAQDTAQKHSENIQHEARKQIAAAADPESQLQLIADILQQINAKIPDQKDQTAFTYDPAADPDGAPLALQLHNISQSDKARKTININENAALWLDSFAAAKGYKIGDLVSLAIIQLQQRIDKSE